MAFFTVKVREQTETDVTVLTDSVASAEAIALLFRTQPVKEIVKTNETQPLTNTVIETTNIIDDDNSLTLKYARSLVSDTSEKIEKVKLLNITPLELVDLEAAITNLNTVINAIKS